MADPMPAGTLASTHAAGLAFLALGLFSPPVHADTTVELSGAADLEHRTG
jgi:hypothetical protein